MIFQFLIKETKNKTNTIVLPHLPEIGGKEKIIYSRVMETIKDQINKILKVVVTSHWLWKSRTNSMLN